MALGKMNMAKRLGCGMVLFGSILAIAFAAGGAAKADDIAGRWSATAKVSGADIPFRLDFTDRGGVVRATFFDGSRPTNPSAPARLDANHIHLAFPSYAAALDLTETAGALDGVYTRGHTTTPIHAIRAPKPPAADVGAAGAPKIGGEWIIPQASEKGEKAWRLIVKQTGAQVSAAILRVDGDTGTLNGRYADGVFRLSHFAGERPALLEIRTAPDGQLKLSLTDGDGHADLSALRPAQALAGGFAPADPTHFTGVKDPSAPFQFAFPDLAGHRVANTDPRFRGKVVVVDVMGSWCPNCHDEAPFLQAMYAKYHKQGLEIVALDFEPADQLADPQRLKAFVARYGLTYTVLLAGEPKAVHEKLPQAQNLNAWPTTFFLNRKGRVDEVHVGFTSPGSGPRDIETRKAVEHEIETLLAQRRAPSV
jgi:thiol-disulfide isomerase/thioredoxin